MLTTFKMILITDSTDRYKNCQKIFIYYIPKIFVTSEYSHIALFVINLFVILYIHIFCNF